MKNYPLLKEEYLRTERNLQINGPPTIDFLIRYEKSEENLLYKVVSNFKKTNLWECGQVDLLRFADEVFKKRFDHLVNQYKVIDVVKG